MNKYNFFHTHCSKRNLDIFLHVYRFENIANKNRFMNPDYFNTRFRSLRSMWFLRCSAWKACYFTWLIHKLTKFHHSTLGVEVHL